MDRQLCACPQCLCLPITKAMDRGSPHTAGTPSVPTREKSCHLSNGEVIKQAGNILFGSVDLLIKGTVMRVPSPGVSSDYSRANL